MAKDPEKEQKDIIESRRAEFQQFNQRAIFRQKSLDATRSILENKTEMANPRNTELIEIIAKSSKDFRKLKSNANFREYENHANFLTTAASIASDKADNIKTSTKTLNFEDFVANFEKDYFNSNLCDDACVRLTGPHIAQGYAKFADHIYPMFRRPPVCDTIVGSLSLGPRVRKVSKARLKSKIGEATKPSAKKEEHEDINSGSLQAVRKVLRDKRKGFFRNMINPNNFGETIENLYRLSFSVKDGIVGINDSQEHEEPVWEYNGQPLTEEIIQAQQLKRKASVLSFDCQEFERVVREMKIMKADVSERLKVPDNKISRTQANTQQPNGDGIYAVPHDEDEEREKESEEESKEKV